MVGSYLRLIDSCITQVKAQGASRTYNEGEKEEEEKVSPQEATPEPPGAALSLLDLRTTAAQKCEAVSKRARIRGS